MEFVCGQHFCELCSDCMHCCGHDPCYDGGLHYYDPAEQESHPGHGAWQETKNRETEAWMLKVIQERRGR